MFVICYMLKEDYYHFDQDVYGRGVLEMKSIYHLEKLGYIRVSREASIHPGDK